MMLSRFQSRSSLRLLAAIFVACLAVAVAPPKKTTEKVNETKPVPPPKNIQPDSDKPPPVPPKNVETTTSAKGELSYAQIDDDKKPLPPLPKGGRFGSIVKLGNDILGGISNTVMETMRVIQTGTDMVTNLPGLIMQQIGPKSHIEEFVNKYKVPDKVINIHEMQQRLFSKSSQLTVKDITISNFHMSQILPTPTIGEPGNPKAFSFKLPEMEIEIDVNLDLVLSLFTEGTIAEIPLNDLAPKVGQLGTDEAKKKNYARIEWPFTSKSPHGHYWMRMAKMVMELKAEFRLVPAADAITAHEKYTIVVEDDTPKKTKMDYVKELLFGIKKTGTLKPPAETDALNPDDKPALDPQDPAFNPPPHLVLDKYVTMEVASKTVVKDVEKGIDEKLAEKPAAKKTTLQRKKGATDEGHIHDPKDGYRVVLIPTTECAGFAKEFDSLLKKLGMWGLPERIANWHKMKKLVHENAINYVLQSTVCNTVTGILNGVLIGFQEKASFGKSFLTNLMKSHFKLDENEVKNMKDSIDKQNKVDTKAVKAETAKENVLVMPDEKPGDKSPDKSAAGTKPAAGKETTA